MNVCVLLKERNNIFTWGLTTKELYDITQKVFEERQRVKPFVFYASQEVMEECNRPAHEAMNEYLEGFRKRNELR